MLRAALRSGAAPERAVFEVFARHLPNGRRYGVVAGTGGRLLDALEPVQVRRRGPGVPARSAGVADEATLRYLGSYAFGGDIWGYAERRLLFPRLADPGSGGHLRRGRRPGDAGPVDPQSRLRHRLGGLPDGDRGRRQAADRDGLAPHPRARRRRQRPGRLPGRFRVHLQPAGGRDYAIPTSGTSGHAFSLAHDSEREAFDAQLAALGTEHHAAGRHLRRGHRGADRGGAGWWPQLGAVRIDSGDLPVVAQSGRALLDSLGASQTRIVLTGDLDEYSIAALAATPVDGYGVGTSLVTGSGAPTAALVYKLVAQGAGRVGRPRRCARWPSGRSASRAAAAANGRYATSTPAERRRPS